MIPIKIEKLYSIDRINELCSVAIPLAEGKCVSADEVCILDENMQNVPTEAKPTARWADGSIKWLYAEFLASLRANKSYNYCCRLNTAPIRGKGFKELNEKIIDNGVLRLELSTQKNKLFEHIYFNGKESAKIGGAVLADEGGKYDFKIDKWQIAEKTSLKAVIIGNGFNSTGGKSIYAFKIRLTIKPCESCFELGYTLVNTTMKPLNIKSLIIEAEGSKDCSRSTVAHSNYKTTYHTNNEGKREYTAIDANYLLSEANEHFAEVFYGTFFGDVSSEASGICATIYQAQQNFPKALTAEKNRLTIALVPEGIGSVTMPSGTSREQKVLFELHNGASLRSLNNTSTLYQMPDRPVVMPEVFKAAGVFTHVITDKPTIEMERFLMAASDEHSKAYGMMNWGDSPDMGYTAQGRGNGHLVWTNNEYDFPHACMLAYARTGIRRYIDYVLVTAKHWLDVDICHYSDNPLELNGQWEHTYHHNGARHIACSHEWVEGLLDFYHLTGDEEVFEAACNIGHNVQALLDTPMFQQEGEINARETGWALRSLTALYIETGDESWLEKCEWIVGHFRQWMNKYGLWLSPYTDNTEIRVVFMIAIAIGSLMRYYAICKSEQTKAEIKRMILISVDDLIENAMLGSGLFIYKELPSLTRLGNNPCILEALAIAYELTGEKRYLEAGIPTLKYVMDLKAPTINNNKRAIEDTVLVGNMGTKSFAQLFVPICKFYKAAAECGLIK